MDGDDVDRARGSGVGTFQWRLIEALPGLHSAARSQLSVGRLHRAHCNPACHYL